MDNVINPFKEVKKDWAKKSHERVINANKKEDNSVKKSEKVVEEEKKKEPIKEISSKPEKKSSNEKSEKAKKRVAKSFKIYPGQISRDFDKRVNKLQVRFDDLGYDKNYVDSGKYMMFLMAFAEKYRLYEFYKSVDESGELHITQDELEAFIQSMRNTAL